MVAGILLFALWWQMRKGSPRDPLVARHARVLRPAAARFDLLQSFRNHIAGDAPEVRAAYDRFLSNPVFDLVPTETKRSVRFTRSGEPKGGYYSFIVNRRSLLFYIRQPAWCEQWTRQRDALADFFKDRFRENEAGEWTLPVLTVDDVELLEDASRQTPYPLRRREGHSPR